MNRLSIVLVAGVSALALTSAVSAADLIIEEPYVAPVVDTGDWEGPFIGVFAGYGWGTVTDDTATGIYLDTVDELDLAGWLVGLDVGYNFYLSEGIVLGVVADIAWSDISGTDSITTATFDTDWLGSVRGRLGFDGGAFMPYLTAGLAVAGTNATDPAAVSDSATHIGWTVGAGVEIAATEDLSIDILYRYSDYGAQDYALTLPTTLSLTTHTIQAGLHWNF